MITLGSAEHPCKQCGNTFVYQVNGVCFNCITRPLIATEGHALFCDVWRDQACNCHVRRGKQS